MSVPDKHSRTHSFSGRRVLPIVQPMNRGANAQPTQGKNAMLPNLDRPHRRRILLRAAVAAAVLAANPEWLRAQPAATPRVGVAPQAHLRLQIRDVPTVVERLRAAGRPVDAWTLDETGRAVTEDPFGNRLELISRPAEPVLYRKDHHVTQLRISV